MSSSIIRSHIQMPKCLLKRFEDESHRLYYYDVEKNCIGSNGHAKSINTQLGYFSGDTEAFLRDNIETPFAEVLEFIEKNNFNGETFWVDSAFAEKVKVFIYALIARDPNMLKEVKKYSKFVQFIPERTRHDYIAVTGTNLASQKAILNDFIVTFSVNKTEMPFILPVCGLYTYKSYGFSLTTLPVSPKLAITLAEPKARSFLIRDNIVTMFLIEDVAVIRELNMCAMKAQCKAGWGYIVSPTRNALEDILRKPVKLP